MKVVDSNCLQRLGVHGIRGAVLLESEEHARVHMDIGIGRALNDIGDQGVVGKPVPVETKQIATVLTFRHEPCRANKSLRKVNMAVAYFEGRNVAVS